LLFFFFNLIILSVMFSIKRGFSLECSWIHQFFSLWFMIF
jgi:hypothetical protein